MNRRGFLRTLLASLFVRHTRNEPDINNGNVVIRERPSKWFCEHIFDYIQSGTSKIPDWPPVHSIKICTKCGMFLVNIGVNLSGENVNGYSSQEWKDFHNEHQFEFDFVLEEWQIEKYFLG